MINADAARQYLNSLDAAIAAGDAEAAVFQRMLRPTLMQALAASDALEPGSVAHTRRLIESQAKPCT